MERVAVEKRRKNAWKNECKMEAFYNYQFKRDDLLNILKKKEAENEANMLRKIEGFKYLYREQFKEFEKLMKISSWRTMMCIEE